MPMATPVGTAPKKSPAAANSTERVSKNIPSSSTQGVGMIATPMPPMMTPVRTRVARPRARPAAVRSPSARPGRSRSKTKTRVNSSAAFWTRAGTMDVDMVDTPGRGRRVRRRDGPGGAAQVPAILACIRRA